jgi:hypothetical protein
MHRLGNDSSPDTAKKLKLTTGDPHPMSTRGSPIERIRDRVQKSFTSPVWDLQSTSEHPAVIPSALGAHGGRVTRSVQLGLLNGRSSQDVAGWTERRGGETGTESCDRLTRRLTATLPPGPRLLVRPNA